MTAKILLIEDDKEIARLTKIFIESEGYVVESIEDGTHAVEKIRAFSPDLVLLDLMLPGKDGATICKEAREFYTGMVMVLTAHDDDMSEVSLFKLGADDYIIKPIRGHILVARIEALMRRYDRAAPSRQPHVIDINGLVLNTKTQTASYDQTPIELTESEFEILQLLAENVDQVVTREACCQSTRGIEYSFNNRSIDMRVSGLRRKLVKANVQRAMVKTVRNQGYKLVECN